MRILLTNDDGIMAEGIQLLKKELEKEHEVYVVAPDVERSATGHAITLRTPIWAKKISIDNSFMGYAVSGTPADCVKLGLQAIYKDIKFDLVISGINRGGNVGIDILYSGTVSAALEGALSGIPSIAISALDYEKPNYEAALWTIKKLLNLIDISSWPSYVSLNINVPNIPLNEIKGFKITKQSKRRFKDYFEERKDPYGNTYYWMLGEIEEDESFDENIDCYALKNGYVSITPISFILTAHDSINYFNEIFKEVL